MKEQRPIKKEQLYNMDHFIHYCRFDEQNSRKLGNGIIASFLSACEKEGLLVPLHSEEQVLRDHQGQEHKKTVKFYSPFQIFFASALSENAIDDEGYLRNPDLDWEPQPGQRARYINWSGRMSFNADIYKNSEGHPPVNGFGINHFDLANYFHNFLKILHSLQDRRHDIEGRDDLRYYTSLPSFRYDLEPFKDDDLLASYDLDVKKLKILLENIGSYATYVDPLEIWFYYAKRHPQWRRDELKGMASVAQDLYGLCDILTGIIEMKTGEKLPSLLDFLHPTIKPYHMKKGEYAHGTDLSVIKDVLSELKSWMEDPSNHEVLEKIKTINNGTGLDQIQEKISLLDKQLADFEKRYGDRRRTGGRYVIYPETELTLADLDLRAKQYVEMIMRQRREHGIEMDSDEEERLRTSDPEILALWKKGKKAEAEEKYFAIQEQYEIPRAIDHVLDEIQRGIIDICSGVANSLYPFHHQAEREKKMAEPEAIRAFMSTVDRNDPKFAGRYSQFWSTGMKEALKKYDAEMDRIRLAQDQMHGLISKSRLVYCAECRKNPVLLHQQHNDGKISGEAICDDCIPKIKDLHNMKNGEWKCRYIDSKGEVCDTLLYKFAHNNILKTNLQSNSPAKITLEYGRIHVEVSCKKCRNVSEGEIDWGWLF